MTNLSLYLELERLSLEADDETADKIRDVMDPIWHRLTEAEIAQLDSRGNLFVSGQTFTGEVGLRLPLPKGL